MTGIEPAYSAWEAFSTPERLSDISGRRASGETYCTGHLHFGTARARHRYGFGTCPVRARTGYRDTRAETPSCVGRRLENGQHERGIRLPDPTGFLVGRAVGRGRDRSRRAAHYGPVGPRQRRPQGRARARDARAEAEQEEKTQARKEAREDQESNRKIIRETATAFGEVCSAVLEKAMDNKSIFNAVMDGTEPLFDRRGAPSGIAVSFAPHTYASLCAAVPSRCGRWPSGWGTRTRRRPNSSTHTCMPRATTTTRWPR
jgi:hypothetical protein